MKHFKKILLSSLVTVSSSSYAEEVTFEFEGELGPNLNSGLFEQGFGTHPIGTKFTGYVIYDNDQVDQSPQLPDDLGFDFGKTKSSYAYTELSITIGNDTVIDYGGSIDVHDKIIDDPNSINSHSSDSIYIYSSSDTDATVGGLALDGISLWFVDNNGDAFNDQSLPNKIDLAKFSYGQIQLSNKIDYNSTYSPKWYKIHCFRSL